MAVITALSQLLCAPSLNDLANKIERGMLMLSKSSLRQYGCKLSCPGDLFGFRDFSFSRTMYG